MEFPGESKKEHVEFPGFNEKQNGILKGDQEKIVWNFQGTWFLALEFSRDLTRFCRISRGGALFYLDFPGVKKRNIPYGVLKKVCPQPTCSLSEIAQHIQCLIPRY